MHGCRPSTKVSSFSLGWLDTHHELPEARITPCTEAHNLGLHALIFTSNEPLVDEAVDGKRANPSPDVDERRTIRLEMRARHEESSEIVVQVALSNCRKARERRVSVCGPCGLVRVRGRVRSFVEASRKGRVWQSVGVHDGGQCWDWQGCLAWYSGKVRSMLSGFEPGRYQKVPTRLLKPEGLIHRIKVTRL